MCKNIVKAVLYTLVMISMSELQAQSVIGPDCQYAWAKTDSRNKKPVPYPYVREADVIWSKRVWRVLDMREKMNHPLYYPLQPLADRQSLFDVIKSGIRSGEITAYSNPVLDDEFQSPMSKVEAEKIFVKTENMAIEDLESPGIYRDTAVLSELSSASVMQYWIKEDWFFDKQRSVMEVRIVGICPLKENYDEKGELRGLTPLFWIYYPQARNLFVKHETFVRHNNARRMNYDEIFMKRFFASYIYKESNVYDRRIDEYASGLTALQEGEEIKKELLEYEHDFWHY